MAKSELDYSITHIAVEKLSVVWAKSQRRFQEKWAKQIADNFDPDMFEPVVVTKPNGAGIFHIVEGQHRKAAVEMLWGTKTQIPCHVIDHGDPAKAADIWLGINKGRKAVRPIVRFLIAVEAKHEIEVAINNVVRREGYKVTEDSKADNTIMAVGALQKVYNLGGEKLLTYVLQLCRLLWGNDPHGVSGPMLRGLAIFLNEFHEHVDPKRMCNIIHAKYKSPWKLQEAAALWKERASDSLDVALAELVRMQYNKSQRDPAKKLKRKDNTE